MTDHHTWAGDGLQNWKAFRIVLHLQALALMLYCCQIQELWDESGTWQP